MNKNFYKRILSIVLSLMLVVTCCPIYTVLAETTSDNSADLLETEGNAQDDNEIIEQDNYDEELVDDDYIAVEDNSEDLETEEMATLEQESEVSLDNGSLNSIKIENNVLTGVATPNENYDLASIRILYGSEQEKYIDYEYKEAGNPNEGYSFSIENISNYGNYTLTATFFDTKKWDGAVDISWYNPADTSYNISTPAQLAGVAAIVNGMVDEGNTSTDQIKALNRGDIDKYIQTEKWKAQILEQQGGGIDDYLWRLPVANRTSAEKLESDDKYNDMRYRTINITKDIDMTGYEKNYTPIGGKYAMNDNGDTGELCKQIDTRFNGVFDGHGHTITVDCHRFCKQGFGYTWNVGLIGYLGGGVDYDLNSAKDNKVENYTRKGYAPAVRNVVLKGSIKGRRGTGGIVGRIGHTNGCVVVEKCANYATVRGTDKVGCGGIVGAPWGNSVIRSCYNAGTVRCTFDEVGGIVGSNGYGYSDEVNDGADIYDCFNVGNVEYANVAFNYDSSDKDKDVKYTGNDIGYDGAAWSYYTVDNCYYLKHSDASKDIVEGFNPCDNYNAYVGNIEGISGLNNFNSDATIAKLNSNGKVFVKGDEHPVLYFEKSNNDKQCTVTIGTSNHGSININEGSSTITVPYGTTINLSAVAESGYRLSNYVANDGSGNIEVPNNFYTVTENVTLSGIFIEKGKAKIIIPEKNGYTIIVKKDDGQTEIPLQDGDIVQENDIIAVYGQLKDGSIPANVDYEYTGKFGNPTAVNPKSITGPGTSYAKNYLKVTGEDDVVVIIEPKMQLKDWATYADVSWYVGNESNTEFTLDTAQELAGFAKLLCAGSTGTVEYVDNGTKKTVNGSNFANKTVKLGADIDLANTDKEGGNRLWRTVGNVNDTFKGTFDGNGYTIKNIFVSFAVPVQGFISGHHGGIFGFTDGATIKNLTVEGKFWATAGNSGAIVGQAKNTTIENCVSKVEMENCKETGGIVGDVQGTTVVKNCKNLGTMSGMYDLGGIVSSISAVSLDTNAVQIIDCRNEANIDSTFYNNAGIVAECTAKSTITNCINVGNITSVENTTPLDEDNANAGLVAIVDGALKVNSSVNTGKVEADGYIVYNGGLAGLIKNNGSSFTNCYNTGDVISNSKYSKASVAGIANFGSGKYPTVENCYNAGIVNKGSAFATTNYAGTVSGGSAGNIINVYCTNESIANIGKEIGIAGKAVAADSLKTMCSTLGSEYIPDIENENKGFPVLNWQNPNADFTVGTTTLKSATKNSNTAITLAWTKAEDADGYEIYRSTSSTGTYSKIKTISDIDTLSFQNTGLTPGEWYYYKVRAYKDFSGNAFGGDFSAVKNVRLGLGKVTLSKVSNVKGKKAKVTWKKLSGATGYQIQNSLKKNKKFKTIKTITSGSTVSYTKTKLKKGKTYYFRVRALSKKNGQTVYGAWSSVKKVKIKK